jgi:anthranilate synthase component 1
MELIDASEPTARSWYGGALGFMGFDGSCNHAIMIRSFLSKDNTLRFQAGAGVVVSSDPQKELEEVNHKLGALRLAINQAAEMQA